MPWEKGQVVVGFSRTRTVRKMAVVSNMRSDEIARALWIVMSRVNQWTAMLENIIRQLSISPFDKTDPGRRSVVNVVEEFPWQLKHYNLPLSKVGYVYLLVSVKRQDKFYVGQTKNNIPSRLKKHNSGHGAKETSVSAYMPWAPVAFIAGTNNERELEGLQSLEKEWQLHNHNTRNRGITELSEFIDNGKRVVDQYNQYISDPERKIYLQVLLTSKSNSTEVDTSIQDTVTI